MAVRTGRHCIFMLHVHLVFVTKSRKVMFTDDMLNSLKMYFEKVCRDFESELKEFNGEKDYVHLLVTYPPKVSISKLVNSLKGVSSRKLRGDYTKEFNQIFWQGVLWSPSYFAGSISDTSLSVLKQYIEQQSLSV